MRVSLIKLVTTVGLLVLFSTIVYPKDVRSQEQFAVDGYVEYKIDPNGLTTITHNITVENMYSEYYAKSYTLQLENINPINPQAYYGSKKLNVTSSNDADKITLTVEFEDAIVGKGEKRNFTVSYSENSFVTKTGEIWEITIPRLTSQDTFRKYEVGLLVPTSFGNEAYMTPQASSNEKIDRFTKYIFASGSASKVGITAGFGEFQVFSFNLKYHLENPISKSGTFTIALPPDTSFQKVYYSSLNPKPSSVSRDEDGNWLAQYQLDARERIDVEAGGYVQILSSPRPDFLIPTADNISKNLMPQEYWQTDDPKIKELARVYKNPKAIYDYVSTTLNYDYERAQPNVVRLGAAKVVRNSKSAICMEFTDLFVAIARAAGIPAREVNGYGYTENPEIEPLSLVADVLHAWPEYWDSKRHIWVGVDPTWASTTGGVDFFNKLDLRHFAFVIHGISSTEPFPAGSYKLGPNPQKDVFVSFGKLPQDRIVKPEIVTQIKNKIPLLVQSAFIDVSNNGLSALYNSDLNIYFDDKLVSKSKIESLLPFSSFDREVSIPYSFLSINQPENIKVEVAGTSQVVSSGKKATILYNLLTLIIVTVLVVSVILIKLKKLKLSKNVIKIIKNKSRKGPDQIRT